MCPVIDDELAVPREGRSLRLYEKIGDRERSVARSIIRSVQYIVNLKGYSKQHVSERERQKTHSLPSHNTTNRSTNKNRRGS